MQFRGKIFRKWQVRGAKIMGLLFFKQKQTRKPKVLLGWDNFGEYVE